MKKLFKVLMVFANLVALLILFSINVEASDKGVIKNGIFIGPVDVSGMTVEEAEQAVDEYIASCGDNEIIVKSLGDSATSVKVSELSPVWSNEEEAIERANAVGSKGNIVSRYKEIKDLEKNSLTIELKVDYDDTAVIAAVNAEAENGEQEAIQPTLTKQGSGFVVEEGQAGFVTDLDGSIEAARNTLSEGWCLEPITIDMVGTVEEPKASAEDLKQIKDLLGSYTTSYTSSGAARSTNVANGCSLINGSVVFPGEEFSTYNTVKPFSEANGYAMAGSYLNGTVVDSMGGGICQVSTTLYNAVLRAELEVTERNNHSMIVTYVKVSEDAAIAESAGKDFRFKNNLEYPIYIEGITQDKHITFNIYGVETRPSNRTIEFVSETTETNSPTTESCVANPGAPIGSISVQSAHTGYKGRLWKVVYEDGQEVSKEQINSSSYKMVPKTASVGTAAADPAFTEQMMAAIGTQSIDHCKNVAAALVAQQQAAAQPAEGE